MVKLLVNNIGNKKPIKANHAAVDPFIFKLGFPIDKWFDEEFDQFEQLAPIATKLIKERQYNYYRSMGNTEEEAKEKVKEDKMIKKIEESEKSLLGSGEKVREREEEEIELWEAED